MKKAKQFYDLKGIEEACEFSVGWLNRFKDSHSVRKLVIAGEKCSAEVESPSKYANVCKTNS